MREFGLCEGVLDAVLTRAAGRPVSEIRVRCGIRHAVDPETMAQAFGFVAAGTEADGAAVEVVTVPAIVTCRDCGTSSESTDRLASCPTCHGTDVELSGGDELVLESIRYATAPSLPKNQNHHPERIRVSPPSRIHPPHGCNAVPNVRHPRQRIKPSGPLAPAAR